VSQSPRDLLFDGKAILDPLLEPLGFRFRLTESGRSSGGPFAVGSYSNDGWDLELHVRRALGIVYYRVDGAALEHRLYMQLLGVEREAAYPGFSDDPLDGFRHLRSDLERFAGGFLRRENAAQFQEFARRIEENPALLRHLP
jgi:hypothetical protein